MTNRLAVFLAIATASCHADEPSRSTAVSSACAACTDPEQEAGSYVSIGVMPAPHPISWASPFDLFVTVIGTTNAAGRVDRSHSIGHVLLKVKCGTDKETFISQTGGNGRELFQYLNIYHNGPSYLFKTQPDGKLYDDEVAKDDWDSAVAAQKRLADANEVYQSKPNLDGIAGAIRRAELLSFPGMIKVVWAVDHLAPKPRHRFVRATIRITEDQCRAILAWKKVYVESGGARRYSVHRAPWVMDSLGRYDGGGCASVGFAGAFYAAGLDYKKASTRLTEQIKIGTSRLGETTRRDGLTSNGWFHLQDDDRYLQGDIPCALFPGKLTCYAHGLAWSFDHWKHWSGGTRVLRIPRDTAFTFSQEWTTNKHISSSTVPLMVFEPERFYDEIILRWKNANYDAFGYGDWCKFDDPRNGVPTIVLDARDLRGPNEKPKGRPAGVYPGFSNAEARLPWR